MRVWSERFRRLVLMKQLLQKLLRYRAVAQETRSACLGFRFAGWQLFTVADGNVPLRLLSLPHCTRSLPAGNKIHLTGAHQTS